VVRHRGLVKVLATTVSVPIGRCHRLPQSRYCIRFFGFDFE